MRLKNILLVVEDVERSRRFYEELFGLHVITAFDGNIDTDRRISPAGPRNLGEINRKKSQKCRK